MLYSHSVVADRGGEYIQLEPRELQLAISSGHNWLVACSLRLPTFYVDVQRVERMERGVFKALRGFVC